jgi:hypothetical protein
LCQGHAGGFHRFLGIIQPPEADLRREKFRTLPIRGR